MAAPAIDVVVATLDRAGPVLDVVHDLRRQDLARWRLLLVDQSDAATHAALHAGVRALDDSRVRLIHLARRGLPNARNEGVVRASAPVVLFLDDDVRLRVPDLLRREDGTVVSQWWSLNDLGWDGIKTKLHDLSG